MSVGIAPDGAASLENVPAAPLPAPTFRKGRRGRSEVREVGKNAFWLMISFIVLGITQFGVLGLITRFGGVEEAGIWAYANAFRDPFLAFMDFGTTSLLVAEIARRREESDSLLGNGITLGLIVGFPVLGIMMLVANLGFLKLEPIMIQAIYWTGISALIFTTAASFRSAFRAFNKLRYEAIVSVGVMVVSVLGAFVVLYYHFPFIWLFIVLAAARLVALTWSWVLYNQNIGRLRPSFNLTVIRDLLGKTWAFTAVGLLMRAFTRVDILILGYFHGARAAGYYGLATVLFYQLNTVAQLFTTAILPNMAEAFVSERERVGAQLNATVRVQLLVGLPCTAIGLILAPQIVHFFYGAGYEDTVLIFQLLVTVVLLRFLNQTLGVTLTAVDEQGRRARMLGLTVVVNVVLNFLLIPQWSMIGATVTAVLSEVLLFILTYLVLDNEIRRRIQWRGALGPFKSTLLLVPVLYLLRGWPLLLSLPVSLVALVGIVCLLRALTPQEARALIDVLNHLRFLPVGLRQRAITFVRRCFNVPASPQPAIATPQGSDHDSGA